MNTCAKLATFVCCILYTRVGCCMALCNLFAMGGAGSNMFPNIMSVGAPFFLLYYFPFRLPTLRPNAPLRGCQG